MAWCGELFERAHFLCGLEPLLMAMYDHPGFVHGLLDLCLEFDLGMVEMLGRYPVDAIILSDDYRQQSGPLLSPRHFREFFRPRLQRLFDAIRRTGKTVALHSCGDVSAFLPDFVDLGVEILHPVQPETMDLHRIKRDGGYILAPTLDFTHDFPFENVLAFIEAARTG